MIKISHWILTVVTAGNVLFACEIVETQNAGEKAMLERLKGQIDSKIENPERFIIGAGLSGCERFKMPCPKGKYYVFLTWQWLDKMKDIVPETNVVMPKHATCERVTKTFEHVISIEGVLHDKTLDSMKNIEPLKKTPDIIVMLGGDVQQEDGTWKRYTVEMLEDFLKPLPENKKILFLNGPRTGKFNENEEGKLVEDKEVHRTKTDPITLYLMEHKKENWDIVDFRYGHPSLWTAALKTSMKKKIPILMESSSTSMLSEMRTLGLKPVIYKNPVMTKSSENYIYTLCKEEKAHAYPQGLEEKIFQQDPLASQENIILTAIAQSQ